ncbi:MAG: DUF6703 family protein [Candidatus Nanopelagicales bacterium]|nr:MAG: hypothetical protein E6Q91_00660 [Actinomycetota bacterium]HNE89919.1 hypothetical protein [Actinomycetota bacterium]HNL51159.1 hypothetical protein [Actinomycetota bacterium]HNO16464.1 hypothetical protein [Actinomycetota bacterium]HUM86509.1 hypothetical protein [Actinomycetota bacterium]
MSTNRPQNNPGGRKQFEDLSRGPLQALNRVPRPLVVIGLAAFLVAGLLLPGAIGSVFLVILGLFLLWLIALSWPVLPTGSKVMRLIVVLLVFGAAAMRATGRG